MRIISLGCWEKYWVYSICSSSIWIEVFVCYAATRSIKNNLHQEVHAMTSSDIFASIHSSLKHCYPVDVSTATRSSTKTLLYVCKHQNFQLEWIFLITRLPCHVTSLSAPQTSQYVLSQLINWSDGENRAEYLNVYLSMYKFIQL